MTTEYLDRELAALHAELFQLTARLESHAQARGESALGIHAVLARMSVAQAMSILSASMRYVGGVDIDVPSTQSMACRDRFWKLAQVAVEQGFTPFVDARADGKLSAGIDFGSHMSEVGISADMLIQNGSWFVSMERRLGIAA